MHSRHSNRPALYFGPMKFGFTTLALVKGIKQVWLSHT
jgi:hypothetical protein